MNAKQTKVIACATVIEEMLPFMPAEMAYEVLDFGLHLSPGTLRARLQEAVDQAAGQHFETLLLGYGLCSLAVIGLTARDCTLVIPRVDDCIAIFLGSRQAYTEQSRKEPGTYYLTKGWIEVADTPFDEYERLLAQYGEQRAGRIMKSMLKNYTRLVYIDTGSHSAPATATTSAAPHETDANPAVPYAEYARKTAERFHLRFEELRGSNSLILKLLQGPWDEDFLVVKPGSTITYLDFKISASEAGNASL